jgi:hypothetical protein
MEEADLLKYAGEFDGTICGDDCYTGRVIKACAPRLKVISKWGTGIDSIDAEACSRNEIKIGRPERLHPPLQIQCWATYWRSPAAALDGCEMKSGNGKIRQSS